MLIFLAKEDLNILDNSIYATSPGLVCQFEKHHSQ